jgi:putative tricarboxylic transport membrane protein
MDKRDALSGVVWLAIGLFVLITSVRLGLGDFSDPGSGFVACGASAIFIGSTLLMMATSWFNRQASTPLAEAWRGLRWRKVLIVIAGSVIYLLLLDKLGYLLATFGFMLLLFGLGRMKLWVLLLCALLSVAGSYYIFHNLLKVPLPRGMFSF